MSAIRYYKVILTSGEKQAPIFFYETEGGEFDLQFGWATYSSCMHTTLDGAIHDFLVHVQREHNAKKDGIIVSTSAPVKVSKDEVFQKP